MLELVSHFIKLKFSSVGKREDFHKTILVSPLMRVQIEDGLPPDNTSCLEHGVLRSFILQGGEAEHKGLGIPYKFPSFML